MFDWTDYLNFIIKSINKPYVYREDMNGPL